MNNLRCFASYLLVITFQTICDANPGIYGQPNGGRTPSILDTDFMSGFNNDSPFTKPDFLRTRSLFDTPTPFSSQFPRTIGPLDRTPIFLPKPAVSSFPIGFGRPFPNPDNRFSSFSSNPLSGHSESDGSSDYTRKRTQTLRNSDKNFQSTTSHTRVYLFSPTGSLVPSSPSSNQPIAPPPVANKDSDESSSDDKPKKLDDSLRHVAPLTAAAGAGAAFAALVKKPPQTQVQPLAAAAPNSAIANQPKNDEGKCNWCLRQNCNPGGCQEVANFDAKRDADALQKALQNKNEQEVIDILTHRSDKQMKKIKEEYQRSASSLQKDTEDAKLDSKKLLEALLVPRDLFFAKELNEAFEEGDDEGIIMMLTSLSPCAIKKVGVAYNQEYKKTLAKDIEEASSHTFEAFLVKLSTGNRKPDGQVDEAAAERDAKALIDAGPNTWIWSDKEVFVDIFTDRSFSQLREIIKKYNAISKSKNIVKDITDNTNNNLQKGLLALVHNVQDQPGYFADELEGSLSKLIGSDVANKDMLIRIMRGRCGIDLGDIKDAYPKTHDGKTLVNKIESKSDMPYKEALKSMLKDPSAL